MDAAVEKMEEAMGKSTNTAAIMQPHNPGSERNEHIETVQVTYQNYCHDDGQSL